MLTLCRKNVFTHVCVDGIVENASSLILNNKVVAKFFFITFLFEHPLDLENVRTCTFRTFIKLINNVLDSKSSYVKCKKCLF